MRYSLTKLLLEDTDPQDFGIQITPSEEQSSKMGPVTVLGILKGVGSAILGTLGSQVIDAIVLTGSPRCKSIVKAARAYAKRRDRDVKIMIASRSYEDFIRRVYDPTGSYTPDQRKSLSVCLGVYEDPLVRSIPWTGTTDIQSVSPDDVITQGCRDMKSAAGIAAYDDMISNIYNISTTLRKCLGSEGLSWLAKEFGVDISEINVDLTEDRIISAIIDKREKAFASYQHEINVEGREPFFAMQSVVAARIGSVGSTVADICPPDPARGSPGVLPEGASRLERILIEAAMDPDAAPPEPRTAMEALEAFKNKTPVNIRFVQDIAQKTGIAAPRDVAQIGTVLRLGKSTGVKNIMFKFPKKEEEDFKLGGGTVLSAISPANFSLERVAAGLIIAYLAGFRPKGVTPAVLQIIVDRLAPGGANVSSAGEVQISSRSIGKLIVQALADRRTGLKLDEEKQAAFNLVLYHLVLYGERGGRSERDGRRGRGEPPSAESVIRNAYDTVFGWHALGDFEAEGARSDNIVFAPGKKDPKWYESIMQSVRRDKNAPQYMTSIRMRPQIDISEPEEELEQIPELPEEESVQTDDRRIALRNIDLMWKQVGEMTGSAMKVKKYLAAKTRDATSPGIGGVLPMLDYCVAFAKTANHYRQVTFGAGADLVGLSYGDVFVVGQSEITPEDVWRALCKLTGAQYGNVSMSMTSSNAVREWAPIMSDENQLKAAAGVHRLVAEQMTYPAACIVKAMIDGYRAAKVISSKDINALYSKFTQFPKNVKASIEDSTVRVNISTEELVGSRRTGKPLRRKVSVVQDLPSLPQAPLPPYVKRPKTDKVMKLNDDAPLVVDIAADLGGRPNDSEDDAASGPGPASPPPPPTPAPAPAAPPTPPPSPAPAPGTSEPESGSALLDFVPIRDEAHNPANVPSSDDLYSPVTISVGDSKVFGQANGTPTQSASAVSGDYGNVSLVGIDADGLSDDATSRVNALGDEATIEQIANAMVDDTMRGRIVVSVAFGQPQSVDS